MGETSFKGKFTRCHKMPVSEMPNGWFVVYYDHIKSKRLRHKVHGQWYIISSKHGSVVRNIRFAATAQLTNAQTTNGPQKIWKARELIWIDWQAWIDLNGRTGQSKAAIDLTFKKVGWFKALLAMPKHPEPAIRLSAALGFLSIMLGVLSILNS